MAKFSPKHEFQLEMVRSERQRVRFFLFTILLGFVLFLVNFYFSKGHENDVLNQPEVVAVVMGVLFLALVFELSSFFWLGRLMKHGLHLPSFYQRFSVIIEVSMPTMVMFILAVMDPVYVVFIDSPAFLMYFILIGVSILHLSPAISVMTGVIAGLQYGFMVFFFYDQITAEGSRLTLPIFAYISRAVIIAIAGFVAGYVAMRFKNILRSELSKIRENQQVMTLFGQQVSKEVVDELVNSKDDIGSVKQREATIMFLDIRNFSSYVQHRKPEEIIRFQNAIFSPLMEIITQHKGIINQVMGDGFMASFGIPAEDENHSQNAFGAGQAILTKIKELGETGVIPPTQVGIGVHSGQVITGNIGNSIRKQYSIAGIAVIVAARLEQLNKELGSHFLVSKVVYDRIGEKQASFKSQGPIQVKGLDQPVEVYEVLSDLALKA